MEELYLIKVGEITLKKGNRQYFERLLKENIKNNLMPHSTQVVVRSGRYYLTVKGVDSRFVCDRLSKTFGIVAFAKAHAAAKELGTLKETACFLAQKNLDEGRGSTFKIETRRTDKSLAFDSYACSAILGQYLLDTLPALKVDVHRPDWIIHVELREKGYLYSVEKKGPGGLPVGSAGRGILLLSGGIDSPVAGVLMAKRGLRIEAIYFHTPPYTSEEAHEKVRDLAKMLSQRCGGLRLFSIPFTEPQLAIKRSVPPATVTLHTRAAMVRAATLLAQERHAHALITGEALGQVASQTLKSILYTNRATDLPILRPLVGMDKEEVIRKARQWETFAISTRPFVDCCTLFAPPHPDVNPDDSKMRAQYAQIEGLEELLTESLAHAECEMY